MRLPATLGVLLVLGSPAAAQQHGAIILAPNEIAWGPPRTVGSPGVRIAVIEGNPEVVGPFTMRVMLPANWTIAPHTHKGVEYLTVMVGTLYAGHGERFDPGQMKVLPAGGFMVMPADTPHFLMVREETIVQIQSTGPFVVTYVNPADDPAKR